MRSLLIIVTFILSSVLSGSLKTVKKSAVIPDSIVYAQADYSNNTNNHVRHFGYTPSGNPCLSSEDASGTSCFRSNGSSRRVHGSSKSSSRTIKAGKVVDKHTFGILQIEIRQFSSGIRSIGRYIHTICQLRL